MLICSFWLSLFYYFLIDLYWSIIASQYCFSFCCTTKWISHMHTYAPIYPPSWASLPPSLSHPSRSSQSNQLISLCYAAASHQITILHSVVCICRCYSHFAPAFPSHPVSSLCLHLYVDISKSIPYVYIFIPALQLGSSVPFFFLDFIYTC